MEYKVCKICGQSKQIGVFELVFTGKNHYRRGDCMSCFAEKRREYARKNSKAAVERTKQWCIKNPEKARANGREHNRRYRERNPEKVAEMYAKVRLQLNSSYVKGIITRNYGIPPEEIPEAFVKLRRAIISAKRAIKNVVPYGQ